jgi:transporter family-2 protein
MYLFATLAGVMVVLSMVMNAQLARGVGIFQGVFFNLAVGLLTALPVYFLCDYFGLETRAGNSFSAPWYAFLGAFFAIAIVAACNVVIPKIPVVYSAVLIFLGQIVTGLVIDALVAGYFDTHKAVGALLITAGLLLNAKIDADMDREDDEQDANGQTVAKPETVGVGVK